MSPLPLAGEVAPRGAGEGSFAKASHGLPPFPSGTFSRKLEKGQRWGKPAGGSSDTRAAIPLRLDEGVAACA